MSSVQENTADYLRSQIRAGRPQVGMQKHIEMPVTLVLEKEIMENEKTPVKHGTYAAYTNKKCRCEECKTAAREYMREYRKTESGRERSRLYTQIATKRNNKAAAWVKENHPDVWEKICSEITAK